MLPTCEYQCPICGDTVTVPRAAEPPTCCMPTVLASITCSACCGEGCQHCDAGRIPTGTKATLAMPLRPVYDSIADEIDLDNIARGDRVAAHAYNKRRNHVSTVKNISVPWKWWIISASGTPRPTRHP